MVINWHEFCGLVLLAVNKQRRLRPQETTVSRNFM
jgi:hypothetical protein